MNVEYTARNFTLDDRIREYTEGKLKKVVKFLEEPIEIKVTLELENHGHRNVAELRIAHRFGALQAREETGAMLDAVNLAVDKAEKQARRSRKKFRDKRRKADRVNGNRWPVQVLERESAASGRKRIVKSSFLQIKPMTLDEAALELDSSRNDFVVFRDEATDQVNVLYKRKDDNYGLISPE